MRSRKLMSDVAPETISVSLRKAFQALRLTLTVWIYATGECIIESMGEGSGDMGIDAIAHVSEDGRMHLLLVALSEARWHRLKDH